MFQHCLFIALVPWSSICIILRELAEDLIYEPDLQLYKQL